MGFLLRLYFDALFKGNPLVVGITIIGILALAMGPFQEALARRQPAAIALFAFIILGIVILVTLAIVDRKLNPPEDKRRKTSGTKRR